MRFVEKTLNIKLDLKTFENNFYSLSNPIEKFKLINLKIFEIHNIIGPTNKFKPQIILPQNSTFDYFNDSNVNINLISEEFLKFCNTVKGNITDERNLFLKNVFKYQKAIVKENLLYYKSLKNAFEIGIAPPYLKTIINEKLND